MVRKLLALILIIWAGTFPARAAALTQAGGGPEQAIRKALYELEYAYATGDVETVKRLTAKRTLALYRLYFEAISSRVPRAPDPPEGAPGAQRAGDGDALFDAMLSAVGAWVGQSRSPDEIRKQARQSAERQITFVNERSAKIAGAGDEPPSLALLEDGVWKIDDTEALKAEFLKSAVLTPEEKRRIKEF